MHPNNVLFEQLADLPWTESQLISITKLPRFQKFLAVSGVLESMRDNRIWEGDFASFDDYLRSRHAISEKAFNALVSIRERTKSLTN